MNTPTVSTFLSSVYTNVLYPILAVVFALALVYFLFGVVKYMANSDNDAERAKGKLHMIWGIVGLAVMFGAATIVTVIQNTVSALK